jgi:acetyltransferase
MLACDDGVVILREGRAAAIRSVDWRDAEPIQRFIRGLSPHSRYQRFFLGLLELPAEMLERMLSAPAGREIALVAEAHREMAPRIVGLAQCVAVEHQDLEAVEVAIVVAEDWRRAGLATQLLRRVAAQALSFGFRHAHADILRDNTAAIELARRFGSDLGTSPHGAMLARATVRLELQPPRPY